MCFGCIIIQILNWKPSLHQVAHPKSVSYYDCILLLYHFFKETEILEMASLLYVHQTNGWRCQSSWQLTSLNLSPSEQNMINESDEPSQSSLHFGRNSVLNFVSLFPGSGEGLLVHLYWCNGNTGNMNTHTTCAFSFLHTIGKWGHWSWTAKVGKSGSGT